MIDLGSSRSWPRTEGDPDHWFYDPDTKDILIEEGHGKATRTPLKDTYGFSIQCRVTVARDRLMALWSRN